MVELGEYKGVEIEKVSAEVTEEDIEAEIKKVQEQNARELTVDRPAENGDTVMIDYEGSVDGNYSKAVPRRAMALFSVQAPLFRALRTSWLALPPVRMWMFM